MVQRMTTIQNRRMTMKRYNMRTRVLGAFAALTLAPAAFAQTAQDPVPNDSTTITDEQGQPSGSSYGQQPKNQARVPEMSDSHPPQTPSTRPSANASATDSSMAQQQQQPRAIDPREVQQVFGQQASLIDLKSLSAEDTKNLQQRLKDLGYYQAEVDGVAGPRTKSALNALVRSQFVLTQRLVEQGQMPSQLADTLGVRSDIMPTSGSMKQDMQPQTTPRTNGQPSTQSPLPPPPASYDAPPANYNDSPRSPSGNAPTQQQTVPKR
jgi:putative peptidoglycan binding protein